ncbi:DUF3566 domain-containing protein [bacterium]|nr:DUF3566 domain-containing protein [bacterium]
MSTNGKLVEVKSINAWSAFKLALIAYLLIGLLAGLLIGSFAGLLGSMGAFFDDVPYVDSLLGATGGFLGGLAIGVLFGLFYGIVGGIGAAISALLYDLFASIVGGVKIRLRDDE